MMDSLGYNSQVVKLLGAAGIRVLENINTFVCICAEDEIVYINNMGIKVFKAETAQDVLGRSIVDFLSAEFAAILSEGLEALTEENEGIPVNMTRLNGDVLHGKIFVRYLDQTDDGRRSYLFECHDITGFIQAAAAVKQRQDRIDGILKSVAEAIITIDESGLITEFNPAAEASFGYTRGEALRENINTLIPNLFKEKHVKNKGKFILSAVQDLMGVPLEFEACRQDNSVFPVLLTSSTIRESTGNLSMTAVARDISIEKEQEKQLKFLAYHDQLTGLPNRILFEDRLKLALLNARRSKEIGAIMFIDLDRFKPVNDELGHDAGDAVLRQVSDRLQACVRATDTVARVGGDEFIVILAEIKQIPDAAKIAANIIKSINEPFYTSGAECSLGASIGISIFPNDGGELDVLVKKADEAMYEIKKRGRNNYLFVHDLAE